MTPNSIPLEDEHLDIIGKAQRGLGLSDSTLLSRSSLTSDELQRVRDGEKDATLLTKLAAALNLGASALLDSAHKSWKPMPVQLEGLAQFNTKFGDMTVNAYVCWDPKTREAVIFDTGADASEMLNFVKENQLNVRHVLLTHTHPDHIFDLDRVLEVTGVEAWVNAKEAIPGAHSFEEGKGFTIAGLRVETRLTCGHSVGGTTFVVSGLSKPLAIVGDAIFSGSMGGGKVSYADALRTNREQIMTLANDTVLAPGHGPLTTLTEEKAHNPFFVV